VGSYQAYSLSVQQNTPGLRNPQRTSLKIIARIRKKIWLKSAEGN
jgi:hypothetical protein